MKFRFIVPLAVLATAIPEAILAQADSSTARILLRAAEAAMMHMPRHGELPPRRGVNPREIQSATSSPRLDGGAYHPTTITSSIAASLNLIVREPEDVCSERGCDLGGFSGYLSLSTVRFHGDSAEVFVNVLTPNPRPNAVYQQTFRLGFHRERCGWELRWGEELADRGPPRVRIAYSPSRSGDLTGSCS